MNLNRSMSPAHAPWSHTLSRRTALAAGGLWAAWWLAGCALSPQPRTVGISEAQLAERIARQFPMQRRVMEMFELTLDAPSVRLLPQENRIGTELDYVLSRPGRPGSRTLRGRLVLSYGLRIEPQDQTVRLQEVRIGKLDEAGMPEPLAEHAGRMGGMLAEEMLKDFVVYRIRPEDLQAAGRKGYRPTALTVVPGGLQLRLDPVVAP
jgi:hypothetical protein